MHDWHGDLRYGAPNPLVSSGVEVTSLMRRMLQIPSPADEIPDGAKEPRMPPLEACRPSHEGTRYL